MSATGIRFVLHSHLPFAQLAGRDLQREVWLHSAATEPFVPMMPALNRLRDEGVEPMIVLGLNQSLSELVIDSDLLDYSGIETTIALPRADVGDEDDDFDDDFEDDDFEDDDFDDDELDDEDFDEEDEDYYDDDPDEGDDIDD